MNCMIIIITILTITMMIIISHLFTCGRGQCGGRGGDKLPVEDSQTQNPDIPQANIFFIPGPHDISFYPPNHQILSAQGERGKTGGCSWWCSWWCSVVAQLVVRLVVQLVVLVVLLVVLLVVQLVVLPVAQERGWTGALAMTVPSSFVGG